MYPIFLSILATYGYKVVESFGVVKIIKDSEAIHYADLSEGKTDYHSMIEIVPLKYVKANKVVSSLRRFANKSAYIQAIEDDYILIYDIKANVKRLKRLVVKFDKLILDHFVVMPLRYAEANDVKRVIRAAYKKYVNNFLIETDTRLNRLIISASKELVEVLASLVKKLDVPIQTQGSIEVVYLKYAKAKDVDALLKQVLNSGVFSYGTNSRANKSLVTSYEETNAVILTGPNEKNSSVKIYYPKVRYSQSAGTYRSDYC